MLAREGTTPARLRQLKDAIPSSRRITKTDLAKFLNAWDQKPDLVSFGSQKNFERFMADLGSNSEGDIAPTVATYKQMIAKAILFKATQRLVRPLFPAFQANIAAYTVALMAHKFDRRMDLDRIWQQQDLSPQLKQQIQTWATEIDQVLQQTSAGRMVSEWAKKPECWTELRSTQYTASLDGIPEVNG